MTESADKVNYNKNLTSEPSTKWVQIYKNVQITICHHKPSSNDGKGVWTYYLSFHERQFTLEQFNKLWLKPIREATQTKRVMYNYDVHPFTELELHGGITFYEKSGGTESSPIRVVKIGCDYNHLWDREGGYSDDLESVWGDAVNSVDLFVDKYPELGSFLLFS